MLDGRFTDLILVLLVNCPAAVAIGADMEEHEPEGKNYGVLRVECEGKLLWRQVEGVPGDDSLLGYV